MDPQYRLEGESSTAFARRVKEMIAEQARLISVPWDGYLKYFRPKVMNDTHARVGLAVHPLLTQALCAACLP